MAELPRFERPVKLHQRHPEARWMAYVQHAIKRRLAELEVQGEAF